MSFFRNMSIKSKFLTAIAALFVVCLAFAVLVLLAMKDISGMEERVALEGRLLNSIGNVEARHLQWNIGVANMLLDKSDKEYKIVTDFTTCAWASWIKSPAYAQAVAFWPSIKPLKPHML